MKNKVQLVGNWTKANEAVVGVEGVLVVSEYLVGTENEEVSRDHVVVAEGEASVVSESESG